MEDLHRLWGRKVEERRKALGLTQGQLAKAAKVTQQTISSIELGASGPGDGLKVRLAVALDQHPADLFPLVPEDAVA